MPKRKLEEELETDWTESKPPEEVKVGVKKNSLDSDEDESDADEKQYQILASDDIEGQEEGSAQTDGNVRITPFNMKEEMEEGHFDADGHYHFNKDLDQVKDHWLDNIDWVKVKKTEPGDEAEKKENSSDSSSDDDEDMDKVPFDLVGAYTKIIKFLKPGESVAQALRRLGGSSSLSASQRLKLKKQGKSHEAAGNPAEMLELTELANGLLNATGNMNVYQETFEQISRTIAAASTKKSAPAKTAKAADVLDMYSDDFDEKEKARLTTTEETEGETSKTEEEASSSKDLAGVDEVQWEFKWSGDSEEVHGPHTSTQMQAWVDEGYFKDSVCVRKVGAASNNFYSCRRVDFELYI